MACPSAPHRNSMYYIPKPRPRQLPDEKPAWAWIPVSSRERKILVDRSPPPWYHAAVHFVNHSFGGDRLSPPPPARRPRAGAESIQSNIHKERFHERTNDSEEACHCEEGPPHSAG